MAFDPQLKRFLPAAGTAGCSRSRGASGVTVHPLMRLRRNTAHSSSGLGHRTAFCSVRPRSLSNAGQMCFRWEKTGASGVVNPSRALGPGRGVSPAARRDRPSAPSACATAGVHVCVIRLRHGVREIREREKTVSLHPREGSTESMTSPCGASLSQSRSCMATFLPATRLLLGGECPCTLGVVFLNSASRRSFPTVSGVHFPFFCGWFPQRRCCKNCTAQR